MKSALAIAFGILLLGFLTVNGGLINWSSAPKNLTDDRPDPTGPYVDDPVSGWHFNLSDWHKRPVEKIEAFTEPPMLVERVERKELPPVTERLPDEPLVMVPWEQIGRYGGQLRFTEFTVGYDHYLRHFNQATLLEQKTEPGVAVCFQWLEADPQPGVLEAWERNDDATEFTFRIRRGLKWSDGVPVTTEDVRFYFEDVLYNKEVTAIPPQWARWGGELVKLDVIDRYSFRLTFAEAYGLFPQYLTSRRWSFLMLPKHYLKRYHKRYTPVEQMLPLMKRYGFKAQDWGRFYLSIGGNGLGSGASVPEKFPPDGKHPTLDPWVHVRQPNPGDYILERNPYYYKVDPKGQQLPYIDKLSRHFVSDIQIQNLKILSGETDVQFQFIRLSDVPLFRRGERGGNYYVMLLPAWQDYMLIYPINCATSDPVVRKVLGDARFRRALSLGLNRAEIREAMFLGMGHPAQLAPLPTSTWYRDDLPKAWSDYDPEQASRILDEMGMRWDAEHEYRLSPDGEKFTLRIDFYDVSPTSAPGAEMAKAYWEELGIRVRVQQMDGSRFWALQGSNDNQVTVWWGDGSTVGATSFISGFLMTRVWEQWFDTNGESGQEPPDWAKEVRRLRIQVYSSPDPDVRKKAGLRIFEILSEQLYTIGTVADVPVPFVYSRNLVNLSVAEQRRIYHVQVGEAAEQWFFKP
jgi:peptide/nickel transport system substrate-binding protein